MAVTDWSTTAANNTTLGGIALGEGVMLVADVNDAFRELMAQVAAALGVSIQQYDAGLASIAGLTTAADRMIYTTASDTYAVATLTSFARTLLDDADQATARATLGVDPAGTDNSTDVTLAGALDYLTIVGQVITRNPIDLTTDVTGDLPVAEGGTGASTAGDARTNLGVAIGSDVQAHDADLDALAALASTGMLARAAANTYALRTITAGTGIGVTNGDGVSGNPTVAVNDAELLALAGLTSAANRVPYFTGSGTAGLLDFVDEDDMSSDSATAVPSQQSVKAYVDANAGGLGWTHIQTQVASADTAIDFALPSGYRTYRLTLDITCSATSDVILRVSNDGGSSFISSASSYTGGVITPASASTITTSFNNAATQIRIVTTPFTDEAVGCVAMIYGARESGLRTTTTAYAAGVRSGVARGPDFNSGQRATAETNDAIRVFMASGNFTGNLTLEGLKTS